MTERTMTPARFQIPCFGAIEKNCTKTLVVTGSVDLDVLRRLVASHGWQLEQTGPDRFAPTCPECCAPDVVPEVQR